MTVQEILQKLPIPFVKEFIEVFSAEELLVLLMKHKKDNFIDKIIDHVIATGMVLIAVNRKRLKKK